MTEILSKLLFPLYSILLHPRQSTMTIALAKQDLNYLVQTAIAMAHGNLTQTHQIGGIHSKVELSPWERDIFRH